MEVLKVEDLTICFFTPYGKVEAVKNLSFILNQGEILALVGESGSGKTVTGLAILKLLPSSAKILSGKIWFEGKDLLKLKSSEICKIRGRKIALIPQDPGNALDPRISISSQLKDALRLSNSPFSVEEILTLVGIADPKKTAQSYPFELSGGMKQRVLIGMALCQKPKIIIADEPTTALDVTVQAQILDLLKELARKFEISILFITHNLSLVAEYANQVLVIEKGRLIEKKDVFTLFSWPQHSYTKSLLEAVPRIDTDLVLIEKYRPQPRILEVSDLKVHFLKKNIFGQEKARIRAVDQISFDLEKEQSLGIVGESGCGKTTLVKALLRLIPRNLAEISGQVWFNKKDIFALEKNELLGLRKKIQLIFQENVQALNPRRSVGDQIAEVFLIHRICSPREAELRAKDLMDQVGVPSNFYDRFPIEFSSGERQRLIVARALAVFPELLILDEPVSSLDVSVQKRVLELLSYLKEKYHLSYIFISHDLAVVKEMSHKILVMYLGKIVEVAPSLELISNPLHPYSQALISAVPLADPWLARKRKRIYLEGEPPSPAVFIPGCKFWTRCKKVKPICKTDQPFLREVKRDHWVGCHLI